jgi:DNA-binding transcriptional LysR family regulator
MNAQAQYQLSAADLQVILCLSRGASLAAAAERLGVDTSTVFRSLKRIERHLGQQLFERSRLGYLPSELACTLTEHAEQMEIALEAARSAAQLQPEEVAGSVRISTTDTILHGLIAPSLKVLRDQHPHLCLELHTGNELANLTRRDTDIAVRATKRPPEHLVGKYLGPIRVALYASKASGISSLAAVRALDIDWIAPDDALPEHPSVIWRRKYFPKVMPAYRVNSILTVMEMVALGLGVGILPVFLAHGQEDIIPITDTLDEGKTDLWLLTHSESRHLRRVSTVFAHLSRAILVE